MKQAVGVEIALERAADEVSLSIMFVDADDLVSVRLAEFVESAGVANGFILDRGYVHAVGSRICWIHKRLNHICGTSTVFNVRQANRSILSANEDFIEIAKLRHGARRKSMIARGAALADCPFRAVVYSLDTGDNHSGNRLGFKWRPWRLAWIGKRLREEFPGIDE